MKNFELISKLGEGSYSTVYKVRRKADLKMYALKKVKLKNLSEKEKQNALNEIRILASIKSDHIISYKEAFIDEKEKSLCLVMEFANKGDLFQKITYYKQMQKSFDEIEIWNMFIQILKGLKCLHDLKILHRDLKSANIFLFNNNLAKIGDLNVSKVTKTGIGNTQTGTPFYASPEVWNDESYTSKSDIWSLGCVIYEMITFNPPFKAESMDGLYHKIMKGKYQKIPDKYSKDLSEILKLLLKVDPKVKTIKISKNLLFLSGRLPKANYETNHIDTFNLKTFDNSKQLIKSITSINENNKNLLPALNKYRIKNLPDIKKNINLRILEESEKPIRNKKINLKININSSPQHKIFKTYDKKPNNAKSNRNKKVIISNLILNNKRNKGLNNLYKIPQSPNKKYALYLPHIFNRKKEKEKRVNSDIIIESKSPC